MQSHAPLISLVLLALVCTGVSSVAAEGSANRKLRTVIGKPTLGFAVAQAAPVQVSKSVTVGPLTIGKADAAAAPAPAPAAPAPAPEAKKPEASTPAPETKPAAEAKPAPAAEAKPAPAAEKKEEPKAPAAAPPTPAKTSAPVVLPRGAPVAGTSDINQALQCQSAFNARGGRTGVESALGDVCKEGSASFSALGCCQATAKLLNSGNLNKCACNNLVYQQLCQEVKVQDLTCESLRPTLVACGLQC